MTKKIKKLEKETTVYRSRWESSNKALLEMAEEVSPVRGTMLRQLVRRLVQLCILLGTLRLANSQWRMHQRAI